MVGTPRQKLMSDHDLAVLGGGEVAYLREISPRMARHMLQDAVDSAGNPAAAGIAGMHPSARLYALHAADGTPIAIADSREGALANAT